MFQVTLSIAALCFSIVICLPGDLNLALTTAAAFCSGSVAICGLLALLAMNQNGNVHFAMAFSIDLLALGYCGGAAVVSCHYVRELLS